MTEIKPIWRSFRRRVGHTAVEKLRNMLEMSSPSQRVYIVAKVDVETPEPLYPYRPSERREYYTTVYQLKHEYVDALALKISKNDSERKAWQRYQGFLIAQQEGKMSMTWEEYLNAEEREFVRRVMNHLAKRSPRRSNMNAVKQKAFHEFPSDDKSGLTYPIGRFTTWLRTAEIKEALSRGHLVACREALISKRGNEDRRLWAKLRREVFKCYGRRCMRCGSVNGEMHVDHIKPWRNFPDHRYDVGNLQVLCRTCHEWKGEQDRVRGLRGLKMRDFRQ